MPTKSKRKSRTRRRRSRLTVQRASSGAPSARLLLRYAAAAAAPGSEITLRIVGAAEMKKLNSRHRGKSRPTNVLSFSYAQRAGDVVLCHPVIAREAKGRSKSLRAHYAHLVVHGILHLRGHDHLRSGDAARMERAEIRILRRIGFGNPYAWEAAVE
jgi:probable rRNA maturation factor